MNYNKTPVNKIDTDHTEAWRDHIDIIAELGNRVKESLTEGRCIVAVETYPGVDDEELLGALKGLFPALVVDTRDVLCSKEEYWARIHPFLTDDRVFGHMYYGELKDF